MLVSTPFRILTVSAAAGLASVLGLASPQARRPLHVLRE